MIPTDYSVDRRLHTDAWQRANLQSLVAPGTNGGSTAHGERVVGLCAEDCLETGPIALICAVSREFAPEHAPFPFPDSDQFSSPFGLWLT